MGRKNARDRQARLQRKRNKRATARSGRKGVPDHDREPQFELPPQEVLTQGVMLCCRMLFAGQPLVEEPRELARMARAELGGVLGRIAPELHAFLFEDQPWTLTCDELAPLRRTFKEHSANDLFERLWSLALTNDSRPERFGEDIEEQECAHRATRGFEHLLLCLAERNRSPEWGLRLIVEEAERHECSPRLRKGFEKLLRAAITTVHASPRKLAAQLGKLRTEVVAVFELAQRERPEAAWWACGRVFLQEVLQRFKAVPDVAGSSAYAELVRMVLDAPHAAVELARSGDAQPLTSVHLGGEAGAWSAFLERALDVGTLSFDERVRYQIARLKLLRMQVLATRDDEERVGELLAAFQSLQNLLAHGVPPASRAIPAALAAPLQDFYVEMLETLRCEACALRVTEEQLRAHPEDFRLACLYASGALLTEESFRLNFLAKCAPVRHVSPELFARSVRLWSRAPGAAKSASTLRERLFDPLDREERKQCLIALSRQCLRRAGSVGEYESELQAVLPYFPRDSFVLAELREQTALESSLVFLATMIAPLHTLKLTLSEEQSQQWVSYAREIAHQSRVCSEIVLRCLRGPSSNGFSLAPAVLQSAREQIADFKLRSEPPPATRPVAPKPVKRRRKKKETSPMQEELF